ncbi:unnamed protein product [Prunus armeniaca]|uniref:Uncharacterized protein n=1 Tax=Prunus armeniaca TaxID=36596 RepID=A0A6J5UGL7_PRUAR|nr:unnamed protein product [Prunus armeniaca]
MGKKKTKGDSQVVDYDIYTTIQRWRKIYGLYYYFYRGRRRGQGGEREGRGWRARADGERDGVEEGG